MAGLIERLLRPKPDVMEGLLRLAGGDVDLLRGAIRQAANGADSADLERVVATVVEQRAKRQPPAAL